MEVYELYGIFVNPEIVRRIIHFKEYYAWKQRKKVYIHEKNSKVKIFFYKIYETKTVTIQKSFICQQK